MVRAARAMLKFLLSGCSLRAIRHAKVSILGELIIITGFGVGFLGWTEWIDPQTAVEEFSSASVKNSSDFIILGFVMVLAGLGVYLTDGLLRSLRHTRHRSETSRKETPSAPAATHPPAIRPSKIRQRSSWRNRVVGTT